MVNRLATVKGSVALAAAFVVFSSAAVGGQQSRTLETPEGSAGSRTAARTPWGDLDLQGIWTNFDLGEGFQLEAPPPPGTRPPRLLGGTGTCVPSAAPVPVIDAAGVGPPAHWFETAEEAPAVRPSLIAEPADGRLPPLTASGDQRIDGICTKVLDSYVYLDPWVRCITRGVPASTFPSLYNNAYQILQVPGYVVIYYEMIHDARVIPLDEGHPSASDLRLWMGNSRGRWRAMRWWWKRRDSPTRARSGAMRTAKA